MNQRVVLLACSILAAALAGCAHAPAAPPAPAQAAAPSAQPAPVQTAATDTTSAGPKHKTCQTDYQVGSHISKNTVCLTDDEEDQLHEQEEQQLDVMKSTSGFGPGSGH
jgi:invasion protein IalB